MIYFWFSRPKLTHDGFKVSFEKENAFNILIEKSPSPKQKFTKINKINVQITIFQKNNKHY
jgi:hypothetical protein